MIDHDFIDQQVREDEEKKRTNTNVERGKNVKQSKKDAFGLGASAMAVCYGIGSLLFMAHGTSGDWLLAMVLFFVLPASLFGGIIGGAVFALVHAVVSATGIAPSPFRYAILAGLFTALITAVFVAARIDLPPALLPLSAMAAGLYVGEKLSHD